MLFSWLRKLAKPSPNVEKRKSYRYRIPEGLADLTIEAGDGQVHKLVPINVNREAIAAELSQPLGQSLFKNERRFSCRLQIEKTTITFVGKALRYDDTFVVLKFEDMSSENRQRLEALFPRMVGLSIQQQDLSVEATRWYHGQNDTDLFLHMDETGTLIKSLTFVSEFYYFYWNRDGRTETATVMRPTYAEGFEFSKREPNPLKRDPTPDPAKVAWLAAVWSASPVESADQQAVTSVLEPFGHRGGGVDP